MAHDAAWDCIIVGAGPAGLNAALVLARARRRVLVFDNGAPRNHATHEMHGVLGHDGLDPADLRARGRAELVPGARSDARPIATLPLASLTARSLASIAPDRNADPARGEPDDVLGPPVARRPCS